MEGAWRRDLVFPMIKSIHACLALLQSIMATSWRCRASVCFGFDGRAARCEAADGIMTHVGVVQVHISVQNQYVWWIKCEPSGRRAYGVSWREV